MPRYSLRIVVRAATGLQCTKSNGPVNPFVRFIFRNQEYKTCVQSNTLDPKWEETMVLTYDASVDQPVLRFEINDSNSCGFPDFLGYVEIDLTQLRLGPCSNGWYVVRNEKAIPCGSLLLTMQLTGPANTMFTQPINFPQQQQQSVVMSPATPTLVGAEERIAVGLSEILAILPHEGREHIEEILQKFNGDKEHTLAHLLEENVAKLAAQTHAHAESTYPILGVIENEANKIVSQTHFGQVVEQELETLVFQNEASYGYQTAQAVMPRSIECLRAGGGRRKSLLIGVNYTGTKAELSGCVSDVQRMKTILTKLYHFPDFPEAMVCLTDDNQDWRYRPTKKNMIYGMKWLIKDARPGDVFFFHYSGHGAQLPNKDNTEEDGMDETILPVDWREAGMLRDDELHSLLVKPLPDGARLTALMDCCHSGTGLDLPFVWKHEDDKWHEDFCPFYSPGDVQLLAGCADCQTSADVQATSPAMPGGGAMTTAFISAVSSDHQTLTYPSLMEHLKKALVSRGITHQTPQLSTTQRFPTNRLFNLTDIASNTNTMLGRNEKKIKKQDGMHSIAKRFADMILRESE